MNIVFRNGWTMLFCPACMKRAWWRRSPRGDLRCPPGLGCRKDEKC